MESEKKAKILEEIMEQYKNGVVETSMTNIPENFDRKRMILISQRNFEMIEISSIMLPKEDPQNKENVFELTNEENEKKKLISLETKTIMLRTPYINIKSFRIEEFIAFFDNLYREENIMGQKHFNLIIKLVIETLPNVIF